MTIDSASFVRSVRRRMSARAKKTFLQMDEPSLLCFFLFVRAMPAPAMTKDRLVPMIASEQPPRGREGAGCVPEIPPAEIPAGGSGGVLVSLKVLLLLPRSPAIARGDPSRRSSSSSEAAGP